MPHLEYFLVCRSVSTDVNTDELSFSNVIEDIYLDEDGSTILTRAVAVCSWNVDETDVSQEYQAVLQIDLPGDRLTTSFHMNLEKGRYRYRAIFAVDGIPVAQPGELVFKAMLNGENGATHRVIVHPPGTRLPEPDDTFGSTRSKS